MTKTIDLELQYKKVKRVYWPRGLNAVSAINAAITYPLLKAEI